MSYLEEFIQGHHSYGKTIIPLGVALHHFKYGREDALKMFTQRSGTLSNGLKFTEGVSYHCYGMKDGSRILLNRDTQRAWHAGDSKFMGRSSCNNFLLGYAFEGDTNKEPLTDAQIFSFTEWYIARLLKWNFTEKSLTTHMRIAAHRIKNKKVDISETEFARIVEYTNNLYL